LRKPGGFFGMTSCTLALAPHEGSEQNEQNRDTQNERVADVSIDRPTEFKRRFSFSGLAATMFSRVLSARLCSTLVVLGLATRWPALLVTVNLSCGLEFCPRISGSLDREQITAKRWCSTCTDFCDRAARNQDASPAPLLAPVTCRANINC
jgi:hypothetical protein